MEIKLGIKKEDWKLEILRKINIGRIMFGIMVFKKWGEINYVEKRKKKRNVFKIDCRRIDIGGWKRNGEKSIVNELSESRD